MNMYIELQQDKKLQPVQDKYFKKKRHLSDFQSLSTNEAVKLKLLHSPLHIETKQKKLFHIKSKCGDISPPIFDD